MEKLALAHARLEAFIAKEGLKRTRQRESILEAFIEAGGHVSVEELLRAVQKTAPGTGAATVYRTLKVFVDAGIAEERNFGDGQSRYEPAGEDEHHDHLICTDCNTIFEFEDPVVEARQTEVATAHGLVVRSHRHEIFGSCTRREACPRWPKAGGRS